MLELRGEIGLRCPDARRSTARRVALSSGTALTRRAFQRDTPYWTPSFLPARPWRDPDSRELAAVLVDESDGVDAGAVVRVVAMPEEMLAPVRKLRLNELRSVSECAALVKSKSYLDALYEAVPHLEPFFASAGSIRVLGTSVNEPGLASTTWQAMSGVKYYTGLHVDHWDRAPFAARASSRSRLCINLGRCDRFFHFINRSIEGLVSACRATGAVVEEKSFGRPGSGPATELGFAFMEAAPSYPVISVRVRPGEGYIAPTENIVHDGSTLDASSPDVTLTILGNTHGAQ